LYEAVPNGSMAFQELGWNGLTGDNLLKVLVVEVDFDTDPNAAGFRQKVINAISSTTDDVLQNETSIAIDQLQIIPKRY
jgi:hypothetical protein